MISAVAGPLAVAKFSGIKETGWGIVVFLGVFLVFEGSDSIIFYVAGIGLSSLLGGKGQDLMMNRLPNAGTVLHHGVGPLGGMEITGSMVGVAVSVVLGISVTGCCSIREIL